MKFTRREFGRLALATIPAGYAAHVGVQTAAQTAARPNSVVRGVGIGMNLPYNFGGRNASIDDLINNCVALGVSVIELRTQPIETFLGAPDRLVPMSQPRRGGGATPEQLARAEAEAKAAIPELEKWRLGVSLDRLAELQATVRGGRPRGADRQGGRHLQDERRVIDYRLPPRQGVRRPRHLHRNLPHRDSTPRAICRQASADGGLPRPRQRRRSHWEAGSPGEIQRRQRGSRALRRRQQQSPVPFIKKYHDRITHVHLKDRKFNNGPNTPFGKATRRSPRCCA